MFSVLVVAEQQVTRSTYHRLCGACVHMCTPPLTAMQGLMKTVSSATF